MIKYCIYKHETPNGKVYIGQTMQVPKRRWANGAGYATQSYFYNAILKYGWDNIDHHILINNLTSDEADVFEIYFIKYYNSTDPGFGYNITSGGDNEYTINENTRQAQSEYWTTLARSDSPPSFVKLNMDIVNEIREFYQNNDISHQALADEYEISKPQMTQILNNNKWVDPDYVNHKRKAMWDSKIERAESIRESYQSYEYETHELMKLHNLGHDAVRDIINNTTWVDDEYENVRDKVEREEGMQRARDIRALYATGEYTQMELADKYNMSGGQVCDLIQHNIWADN